LKLSESPAAARGAFLKNHIVEIEAMLSAKANLIVALLAISQSGCIVGGYSSGGGGWFLWPGGLLGLVIIIAILFLIFRRRG